MSRSRHNVARAVLISADRYRDLVGRDASVLESLRGQLDALYAGMQTPEADHRPVRPVPRRCGPGQCRPDSGVVPSAGSDTAPIYVPAGLAS